MGVTQEIATFLLREVSNFGVRSGFVWRNGSLLSVRVDANRPFDAFDLSVMVADPGPDGVAGNADDGAPIAGYNLSSGALASAPFNLRTHLDDAQSDFTTRGNHGDQTRDESLVASFANTRSHENANVLNPNQNINTDDGSGTAAHLGLAVEGLHDVPAAGRRHRRHLRAGCSCGRWRSCRPASRVSARSSSGELITIGQ